MSGTHARPTRKTPMWRPRCSLVAAARCRGSSTSAMRSVERTYPPLVKDRPRPETVHGALERATLAGLLADCASPATPQARSGAPGAPEPGALPPPGPAWFERGARERLQNMGPCGKS
eukprot:scaffold4836_cov127-Isochrysis_galbana.AAC.1